MYLKVSINIKKLAITQVAVSSQSCVLAACLNPYAQPHSKSDTMMAEAKPLVFINRLNFKFKARLYWERA